MATKEPASNLTKTRLTLLALLVLFLAPIILARVAVNQGWLEGAARPHSGHLIIPPVGLVELNAKLESASFTASEIPDSWWLVYIAPEDCAQACHNSLYKMNLAADALNSEQTQVRQLLIEPHSREERLHRLLEDEAFRDLRVTTATPQAVNHALRDYVDDTERASEAGYLYLMNPRGNLLMYYPPTEVESQVEQKAAEIREDIQSLL